MQESNSLTIISSKTYLNGFPISARLQIKSQDVTKLELEDQYFFCDNPTVNQPKFPIPIFFRIKYFNYE